MTTRVKKEFDITETFGFDLGVEKKPDGTVITDDKGEALRKKRSVQGFSEPGPETPEIIPGYVFPADATKAFLLGMFLKDRILILGHTGVGKTSLAEQIAARLNYNLIKLGFDGGVSREDLIGEPGLQRHPEGGTVTYFKEGALPQAWRLPGSIILFDEWDSVSDDCAFVLQRPLDPTDGKIMLYGKEGDYADRLIDLHEDNIIVATANTNGQGDDAGLYTTGTNIQNYSQINRFQMTLRIGWMPKEKEVDMVLNRVNERGAGTWAINKAEAEMLVDCATLMRQSFEKGEMSVPLSPRDVINWGQKLTAYGNYITSAEVCFLNRMSSLDAEAARQIITRHVK